MMRLQFLTVETAYFHASEASLASLQAKTWPRSTAGPLHAQPWRSWPLKPAMSASRCLMRASLHHALMPAPRHLPETACKEHRKKHLGCSQTVSRMIGIAYQLIGKDKSLFAGGCS